MIMPLIRWLRKDTYHALDMVFLNGVNAVIEDLFVNYMQSENRKVNLWRFHELACDFYAYGVDYDALLPGHADNVGVLQIMGLRTFL